VVGTGMFDNNGNFVVTNAIAPQNAWQFFDLLVR
jgi:hypothetical protein